MAHHSAFVAELARSVLDLRPVAANSAMSSQLAMPPQSANFRPCVRRATAALGARHVVA